MALRFICQGCGDEIIIRHLKVGEPAKCKNCGGINIVPPDAIVVTESVNEFYLTEKSGCIRTIQSHEVLNTEHPRKTVITLFLISFSVIILLSLFYFWLKINKTKPVREYDEKQSRTTISKTRESLDELEEKIWCYAGFDSVYFFFQRLPKLYKEYSSFEKIEIEEKLSEIIDGVAREIQNKYSFHEARKMYASFASGAFSLTVLCHEYLKSYRESPGLEILVEYFKLMKRLAENRLEAREEAWECFVKMKNEYPSAYQDLLKAYDKKIKEIR